MNDPMLVFMDKT